MKTEDFYKEDKEPKEVKVVYLDRYKEPYLEVEKENEILKDKIKVLEEKNKKRKEFLEITVQTKNEKIRNLIEEIEFYKKQYEHSLGED